MDDLVSHILAFPPSTPPSDAEFDKQARQLVRRLGEAGGSLLSSGAEGKRLLEILNPAEHTIAYIAVLLTNIEALQKKLGNHFPKDLLPDGSLYPKVLDLVQNFDPLQVRYVGQHFRALLDVVIQATEQSQQPWIAVPVLRDVILRLDPTSSTLTSTHIQFVHLCLRLRLYRDALPILDFEIYNVPPTQSRRPPSVNTIWAAQDSSVGYLNTVTGLTGEVTARDYMQYFIWAAMIHIRLRRWERALLFLEIVLGTPASHATSLIQVEAYKKFVLIGMLKTGKHLSLPRTVSQSNAKTIRALSRPYNVVGEAFTSSDPVRLQGDIEVGQREGIWQKDSNLGLVLEVLKALRKFSVLRLAEMFTALPISEVARRTSPDPSDTVETQQYISDLIVSGELKASITRGDPPMLRFLASESTARTETELQHEIQQSQAKLAALLELISSNDHRLEVSKEYIDHLQKLKRAKDEDEKNAAKNVAGKKGESSNMMDEDVMAET